MHQGAIKESRGGNLRPMSHPEDPIAAKTQWTPLMPGGANFITDHLFEEAPSRFVFRPTTSLRLFGLAFLLVGLGCIAAGPLAHIPFMIVFGLPFVGVGVAVLAHRTSVFDGPSRSYVSKKKQVVPFTSIHALQIVEETVSGSDDPDFHSYELNLVLQSGERINVVDHIGIEEIRKDAQILSTLTGCKVWDAK
jgi:hypothetical protein